VDYAPDVRKKILNVDEREPKRPAYILRRPLQLAGACFLCKYDLPTKSHGASNSLIAFCFCILNRISPDRLINISAFPFSEGINEEDSICGESIR
jgi:hypothetical protein